MAIDMEILCMYLANFDDSLIYPLRELSKYIHKIIQETFSIKIKNDYESGFHKHMVTVASEIIGEYTLDEDYVEKLLIDKAIIFSMYPDVDDHNKYNPYLDDNECRKNVIIYITSDKEIKKEEYNMTSLKVVNDKLIVDWCFYGTGERSYYSHDELLAIKRALNHIIRL